MPPSLVTYYNYAQLLCLALAIFWVTRVRLHGQRAIYMAISCICLGGWAHFTQVENSPLAYLMLGCMFAFLILSARARIIRQEQGKPK